MQRVYEFLKKCATYYLATDDNGQPRVRPFGTILIYNGRLCFQTGKAKRVSEQIHRNPKIEICAFDGQRWIRVEDRAVEVPEVAAQEAMLDAYPELKRRYTPGDGNTEIFALEEGKATICSFSDPAEEISF
ncbi:MAG: pyridoxamine 5'-phosphate oxidase family protein [Thermoguttaceae bacterium]|nr:pyridoxamine 5'-phosphate oxidase family protein [Thermoguttaceae bacterium]